MEKKNLILFTESYPFEGGEQFLHREYFYASKFFAQVHVFPKTLGDNLCSLIPDNIVIHDCLVKKIANKKSDYLKHAPTILRVLYDELIRSSKPKAFLKDIRYHLSEIVNACNAEKQFYSKMKEIGKLDELVIHSAWMNKDALMLSIARTKNHIDEYTMRVHGYDIFHERRKYNNMPFEQFNYAQAKHVILNSKYSLNYKKAQHIFPEKLELCYFGLEGSSLSPYHESDTFVLVSCSDVIELKRVELIVKALSLLDFKVNWVHFGDGDNMGKIKELCLSLPANITYELPGRTKNEEVLKYYNDHMVNAFIHVSRTEGLGFALIEAQSFGIPVIACAAGGVVDVVNDNTGKLLPVNIAEEALAKEIEHFKNSSLNSSAFREVVKSSFDKTFSIKQTTAKFVELI